MYIVVENLLNGQLSINHINKGHCYLKYEAKRIIDATAKNPPEHCYDINKSPYRLIMLYFKNGSF